MPLWKLWDLCNVFVSDDGMDGADWNDFHAWGLREKMFPNESMQTSFTNITFYPLYLGEENLNNGLWLTGCMFVWGGWGSEGTAVSIN